MKLELKQPTHVLNVVDIVNELLGIKGQPMSGLIGTITAPDTRIVAVSETKATRESGVEYIVAIYDPNDRNNPFPVGSKFDIYGDRITMELVSQAAQKLGDIK